MKTNEKLSPRLSPKLSPEKAVTRLVTKFCRQVLKITPFFLASNFRKAVTVAGKERRQNSFSLYTPTNCRQLVRRDKNHAFAYAAFQAQNTEDTDDSLVDNHTVRNLHPFASCINMFIYRYLLHIERAVNQSILFLAYVRYTARNLHHGS